MQYQDVVIHTTAGVFGKEAELKNFPPIEQRVELSEETWVGRLESDLAQAVMDTCESKGFGVDSPVRQFGQLYSFVRELSNSVDIYHWDHDHELKTIIALSRLIHPTFVGFAYAARVGYEGGGAKQIFPAEIIGMSRQAFLSASHTRDWLTDPEANLLRQLIAASKQESPKRVRSALWHHEYAPRTYYLDLRWTLVCTGLEALVHTDRRDNTAQFTRRVPRLASELGMQISKAQADEAYDLRSRLAHGVSFVVSGEPQQTPSESQLHLYDLLEDILRNAARRCICDQSFGDIFRDDDKIRNRWPI